MSIDAIVVGISTMNNGQKRLNLEQPDKSRCAGVNFLMIAEPCPPNVAILLGKPVWGGANDLLCGKIIVGKRIGYETVQLNYNALIEVACGPVLREQVDLRDLGLQGESYVYFS